MPSVGRCAIIRVVGKRDDGIQPVVAALQLDDHQSTAGRGSLLPRERRYSTAAARVPKAQASPGSPCISQESTSRPHGVCLPSNKVCGRVRKQRAYKRRTRSVLSQLNCEFLPLRGIGKSPPEQSGPKIEFRVAAGKPITHGQVCANDGP